MGSAPHRQFVACGRAGSSRAARAGPTVPAGFADAPFSESPGFGIPPRSASFLIVSSPIHRQAFDCSRRVIRLPVVRIILAQVIRGIMNSYVLKFTVMVIACWLAAAVEVIFAQDNASRTLTGSVQNQDLRRVGQALVEIRDQEGKIVAQKVTNEAGEFTVAVPAEGTYSVSAVLETYRSEYVVVKIGASAPPPVRLTLSLTKEISLEVRSPLPPIQYKASSETYSVSRKEIDELPRGNNNELHDILLTIPSAAYGALKQVHIDRKSTRLNSSHIQKSRMPSSA